VRVLYDFVTDPEIGPYARIKRKNRDLAAEKRVKSGNNGNLAQEELNNGNHHHPTTTTSKKTE
jgi:hypothetical protein